MPRRFDYGEDDSDDQPLLASSPRTRGASSRQTRGGGGTRAAALCFVLGFFVGLILIFLRRSAAPLQPPPPHPPLPPSPPPPPAKSPPLGPPPDIKLKPFANILNESHNWVRESVPHFECSDADITKAYWYRWRLFHMHMVRRPKRAPGCGKAGGCWVLTEFLRRVFWSGPHNTIVCPAGHHIMEGRWIRDDEVVDDYARFWFKGDGWRKQYTWWAAYALWQRSLLLHDTAARGIQAELFPQLADHYDDWLRTHYSKSGGCMFTSCHADGEENSAGLDGCRPTINSVMYGEAMALSKIAAALGNASRSAHYAAEALRWRRVLTDKLWSDEHSFFMNEAQHPPPQLHAEIRKYHKIGRGREIQTYFGCLACHRPRKCPPERGWPVGKRVTVRELMGLSSPWYFGAVPSDDVGVAAKYAQAFAQLDDPGGFAAKWGPRTTERRHECYNFSNHAQCNWNGGSWPYETSKTATALINLLQTYPPQRTVGRKHFDQLLRTYAIAHTRAHSEAMLPPNVDEDLHPDDGYWITRRKLHGIEPWPHTGGLGNKNGRDPLRDRGAHYFHSTFNDLVLSGLVGLRAHPTHLEIAPLALLPWFVATRVRLRGTDVSVVWDAYGTRLGHGKGLHVWFGDRPVGSLAPLPATNGADGMPLPPRARVAWDGGSLSIIE